ncbi:MFS transporter [bacterium]|nr:MAG: MFS transporter [bacterium]
MSDGIHARSISILSLGHLCNDVYQGIVPALLPFLVVHRGLSYEAVSALVFAFNLSSAIVQPLFGHLSDRKPMAWLLPAGVLTAGAGVALVGVAPNYPTVFALLLLSGIGVAAFHPEGSRYANYVSGGMRARGMSLFTVGGNLGFALGPVLATVLLSRFGMIGTLPTIATGAFAAVLLAIEMPKMARFRAVYTKRVAASGSLGHDAWWPFARLSVFLVVRAFATFGLMTFIPLYEMKVHGLAPGAAGMMLSVLLAGSAAGTLASGWLADRFGRRAVLTTAMAIVVVLLPFFINAAGMLEAGALAVLIGAVLFGSMTPAVVLGQEYLPNRIGAASGMTLGLSISLGGLGVPVLGAIADAHGLHTVMYAIVGLAVAATLVTVTLPSPRAAQQRLATPAPAPAR